MFGFKGTLRIEFAAELVFAVIQAAKARRRRGDLEGERGVSDVCLNNRRGATLRAIVPIVTLSFSSEKARVVSLISDSLRPLPRPMPMHLGREAVARGNGTVKI